VLGSASECQRVLALGYDNEYWPHNQVQSGICLGRRYKALKSEALTVHSDNPGTFTDMMIITTLTQVARGKMPVEVGSFDNERTILNVRVAY